MSDVVMVSGGLDSLLASALLPGSKQVFVEWGQPYLEMERAAVRDLYPEAVTVRIDGLPTPSGHDFYVPARNLMFATIGVRFGARVCLAGMRDEMCADKSPKAFRDMSAILTAQCREPVEVMSTFWSSTKAEAVRSYLRSGGDVDRLMRTVSCYGSGATPCLDCEACFRRFVALASNELPATRPSESVIRSYGLQRIHSVPMSTAFATLAALESTGTPVLGVRLEDVVSDPSMEAVDGTLRIVYTDKRGVSAEIVQRTLAANGVVFDGVLVGVPDHFFNFTQRDLFMRDGSHEA